MFFSTYHGGITPALGPMPVRCLMARAQGRTSSYVTSDIGATPSGRWQFWQLRWRIGAICFEKVMSAGAAACPAFTVIVAATPMSGGRSNATPDAYLQPMFLPTAIAHTPSKPVPPQKSESFKDSEHPSLLQALFAR